MAATPATYRLKGHIYSWLGGLMLAAGLIELCYEGLFWLRFGVAADITDGIAYQRLFGPQGSIGWAGLRAIMEWLGHQQLGITLVLIGLACAWWGGINHDTAMRREISADLLEPW